MKKYILLASIATSILFAACNKKRCWRCSYTEYSETHKRGTGKIEYDTLYTIMQGCKKKSALDEQIKDEMIPKKSIASNTQDTNFRYAIIDNCVENK